MDISVAAVEGGVPLLRFTTRYQASGCQVHLPQRFSCVPSNRLYGSTIAALSGRGRNVGRNLIPVSTRPISRVKWVGGVGLPFRGWPWSGDALSGVSNARACPCGDAQQTLSGRMASNERLVHGISAFGAGAGMCCSTATHRRNTLEASSPKHSNQNIERVEQVGHDRRGTLGHNCGHCRYVRWWLVRRVRPCR